MNPDTLWSLHGGGISMVVEVARKDLDDAIKVLTHCHRHNASHVFVVDQSTFALFNRESVVRIGVSEHGAACLQEYWDEEQGHFDV